MAQTLEPVIITLYSKRCEEVKDLGRGAYLPLFKWTLNAVTNTLKKEKHGEEDTQIAEEKAVSDVVTSKKKKNANGCSKLEAAKKKFSLEPPEEHGAADTLISDLLPAELRQNKFLLF